MINWLLGRIGQARPNVERHERPADRAPAVPAQETFQGDLPVNLETGTEFRKHASVPNRWHHNVQVPVEASSVDPQTDHVDRQTCNETGDRCQANVDEKEHTCNETGDCCQTHVNEKERKVVQQGSTWRRRHPFAFQSSGDDTNAQHQIQTTCEAHHHDAWQEGDDCRGKAGDCFETGVDETSRRSHVQQGSTRWPAPTDGTCNIGQDTRADVDRIHRYAPSAPNIVVEKPPAGAAGDAR